MGTVRPRAAAPKQWTITACDAVQIMLMILITVYENLIIFLLVFGSPCSLVCVDSQTRQHGPYSASVSHVCAKETVPTVTITDVSSTDM